MATLVEGESILPDSIRVNHEEALIKTDLSPIREAAPEVAEQRVDEKALDMPLQSNRLSTARVLQQEAAEEVGASNKIQITEHVSGASLHDVEEEKEPAAVVNEE